MPVLAHTDNRQMGDSQGMASPRLSLSRVLSGTQTLRSTAGEEIAIPTFSQKLEEALAEVLPSDDPLDAADFDPVTYINMEFPDESSLGQGRLENFAGQLRRRAVIIYPKQAIFPALGYSAQQLVTYTKPY